MTSTRPTQYPFGMSSSSPLHSHRPTLARTKRGHPEIQKGPATLEDHRPEPPLSDVVEPSRCCWPKPDAIPKRDSGRGAARWVGRPPPPGLPGHHPVAPYPPGGSEPAGPAVHRPGAESRLG